MLLQIFIIIITSVELKNYFKLTFLKDDVSTYSDLAIGHKENIFNGDFLIESKSFYIHRKWEQ